MCDAKRWAWLLVALIAAASFVVPMLLRSRTYGGPFPPDSPEYDPVQEMLLRKRGALEDASKGDMERAETKAKSMLKVPLPR